MPSRKFKAKPWWFKPNVWDVIPNARVLREIDYALLQKIINAFVKAKYPTRPKKAKTSWSEPVIVDRVKHVLSCSIDEANHKIVITYIRTPKKRMQKKPKRKRR